jgi:hypothetical protein
VDWYIEGIDDLHVEVADSWLATCQGRVEDAPVLARLDPYRDAVLGMDDLHALRRELASLREHLREETQEQIARGSRMPRGPAVRAALLARLVDDRLAADPFHRTVDELAMLIELAIEQNACVRAVGD